MVRYPAAYTNLESQGIHTHGSERARIKEPLELRSIIWCFKFIGLHQTVSTGDAGMARCSRRATLSRKSVILYGPVMLSDETAFNAKTFKRMSVRMERFSLAVRV